jgi:proteasome lid subunit RPN8/RPN11
MKGRVKPFGPQLRPTPVGPGYVERRTAEGHRIFLHRDVLADLEMLERREHPNETAALLFGRFFTDGGNPCALVRHLVWPEHGEVEGTPATVTITAEGSSGMTRRALERHPCADPVGWSHTHPTFPAYFSGTDRAEQAAWTASASVGLVLSGLPDAEPPYEVFVGPRSLRSQTVDLLRQERGRRASRLVSVPSSPPPTPNPSSPSLPTQIPVQQPAGAMKSPAHRSLRRVHPYPKRQWTAIAVASALAALAAIILWFATEGFGGGNPEVRSHQPHWIGPYQQPGGK